MENFNHLINNFDLLIDSFDILKDFDRSFNQDYIKIDQLSLKRDQKYIEIMIVNSIVVLESDLYRN